jgi:Gram-negative bacterial TonB protein C-terminal
VKLTDETRNLQFQFGPNEAEYSLPFYAGDFGKDSPAVFITDSIRIAPPTKAEMNLIKKSDFDNLLEIAPIQPERLAAVRELSIGSPLRKPVVLETGPLLNAFEAMGKCTDNLLSGWGIDAAKHKNLKRAVTPKSNPGTWLTSNDYPTKMLLKGARSIVNFRLSVDAAGLPTACAIQGSTKEILFDEIVCRGIMKRARFEPALAEDGTPIASYYINTVRFALPRAET